MQCTRIVGLVGLVLCVQERCEETKYTSKLKAAGSPNFLAKKVLKMFSVDGMNVDEWVQKNPPDAESFDVYAPALIHHDCVIAKGLTEMLQKMQGAAVTTVAPLLVGSAMQISQSEVRHANRARWPCSFV